MLPLQIRPRDFCWASEGDVVPLTEYLDELRVSSCAGCELYTLHRYLFQAIGCLRRGADPKFCYLTFALPAHLRCQPMCMHGNKIYDTPYNVACLPQETARADKGRGDAFHDAVNEVHSHLLKQALERLFPSFQCASHFLSPAA